MKKRIVLMSSTEMMDVPTFIQALEQVSSLGKNEQYGEAYRLVSQLLEVNPFSARLLVDKGDLLHFLDDDQENQFPELQTEDPLELIKNCYMTAHIIDPNLVEPLIELGYFEYAIHNASEKGLKHFELAQEIAEADLKQALIGQAKCYIDLEQKEEAWRVIAKLRVLFPEDEGRDILALELELE